MSNNLGNKQTMAQNIKYYMEKNDKSRKDMCEALGVSYMTFADWVNAKTYPRIDKIEMMAQFFRVSKSDLVEERKPVSEIPRQVTAVRIPVLGHVAAGIPISAITDVLDWEEIPEAMASGGEYYGLALKGDSMAPEMRSGDVVIVRAQPDAETGDIVVVQVNGDSEATCKRLVKYDNGIILMSINPDFPPMQFTAEDIINSPVHVIGKVVEVRRKM